ncbi:MAG TPA: ABC transporter ATP-binding protein, partial [Acidimicrobiales bacterium]
MHARTPAVDAPILQHSPAQAAQRRHAQHSSPYAARAIDAVKQYGRGETAVRALDGVTVGIPRGRFTAVMGPSGSGKSTL